MSSQTFNAEVVDAIFCERDQLKAENEKLRGLVRKVERFERIGCYECPYAGCGADTLYDDDCPMRREIEQDKRELGVMDA